MGRLLWSRRQKGNRPDMPIRRTLLALSVCVLIALTSGLVDAQPDSILASGVADIVAAPAPILGLMDDSDGGTMPNGSGPDDDHDGCANMLELGSNAAAGGLRDPNNFWDFFDLNLDGAIGFPDVLLLLQHFGTNDAGGTATINRNSDPLTTPDPGLGTYHPRFDRGAVVGDNPWNVAPPDGTIALSDVLTLLSQFGHCCVMQP